MPGMRASLTWILLTLRLSLFFFALISWKALACYSLMTTPAFVCQRKNHILAVRYLWPWHCIFRWGTSQQTDCRLLLFTSREGLFPSSTDLAASITLVRNDLIWHSGGYADWFAVLVILVHQHLDAVWVGWWDPRAAGNGEVVTGVKWRCLLPALEKGL